MLIDGIDYKHTLFLVISKSGGTAETLTQFLIAYDAVKTAVGEKEARACFMIVTDPVYLSEPYVNSQEFVLMDRANQNWLYPCEYVTAVPQPKHRVPHFLPGEHPFIENWADKFGLPLEAVWGGAETMYPDATSQNVVRMLGRESTP